MRPIVEGSRIVVVMSTNGLFDFAYESFRFEAVVISCPADTGDLWYLRHGNVNFTINPCSSVFVGFESLEN